MNYRDNIRVDADLLLEFFLTFARAEFALKNSGFVKGDQRKVLADWESFAESIENNFRKDKNKSLSQAVNYYG